MNGTDYGNAVPLNGSSVSELMLGALKFARSCDRDANARKDLRHHIGQALPLGRLDPSTGAFRVLQEVWCTDMSLSGVGVITPVSLLLHSPYWIDFTRIGVAHGVYGVEVVRSEKLVAGVMLYGCRFIET